MIIRTQMYGEKSHSYGVSGGAAPRAPLLPMPIYELAIKLLKQ